MLKAADHTLAGAVASTLEALDLEDSDMAAKQLARTYAKTLDEADDETLPKIAGVVGPSLLKVLESLGATPKARAEIGKRVKGAGEDRSALGKLRAARGA